MVIGLLKVDIHLHAVFSLKDKRRIIKSLIERLKSRFNASVAEISAQDNKQLGKIGIAVVTNSGSHADEQLDNIVSFILNDARFVTGRIEREIFTSEEHIGY